MNDEVVLIVDDEPTNLTMLNKVLAGRYRIRAASSGERALQVAVTDPRPDLVLLDVEMPGMDGYQVLSRLKENQTTRGTPVIFVTSREAAEDEERGLGLGAVDYITKPIRPAILLARVRTHLILKQASDFLQDKNAFLEEEVARRMEENDRIQSVSIRALAHLAETRDPETGNHILRTQSYVQLLATRLQAHVRFSDTITDNYILLLGRSAPLHDIGKVGIPDSILLKPGKLTDDEWVIMKTHTTLGARAIDQAEQDVDRPVQFLTLAKEIARSHHERWDGSGYPDGLGGNDIPVSARLMALADVFDALISQRVYKPPLPFEEARQIIASGRGSHFDPDVTDAFLAEFEAFVAIARKYGEEGVYRG
ncbi:MAG: two-component system response regulator [Gammaproteobacteria bacterium]|nr:two-component system response regulator [Gammaproteobacteria bacterium]